MEEFNKGNREAVENCQKSKKQDNLEDFNKGNREAVHFYSYCIPTEVLVKIVVNGETEKTGFYICYTCKTAMLNGKVPSMSVINGLHLTNIEKGCHMTELENNLI